MAEISVDLAVRTGDHVLEAAFEAEPGICAIFGQPGAGKSALLRAVAGLQQPERARIEIGGELIEDSDAGIRLPARLRRIGYVFRDDRLFPHMNVMRNITYGASDDARADLPEFHRIVTLLGIAGLLERQPAALSGEERKRVAIARALMLQPRLLLIDQPFASLDPAGCALLMPFLERIRAAIDIPVLYASHEVDEIARLADTAVILSQGRVVASGRTPTLFARPDLGAHLGRDEAGVLLRGIYRYFDPRYRMMEIDLEGYTLYLVGPADEADLPPRGTPLRLRVHASDVALALAPHGDLSVRNQIPLVIERIEKTGDAFAVIHGMIGLQALRARITRQTLDELALHAGMTVYALIKSAAFDRGLVRELRWPSRNHVSHYQA